MRTVLGETAPTLDDLVQNPSLEEVWINGPDQVFVAERGVSRAVPMSLSAIEIRGFVERVPPTGQLRESRRGAGRVRPHP